MHDLPVLSIKNVIDWLRGDRSMPSKDIVKALCDLVCWGFHCFCTEPAHESGMASGLPADDQAMANALEAKLPVTMAATGPGGGTGAFPWAALLPVLLELLNRFIPPKPPA